MNDNTEVITTFGFEVGFILGAILGMIIGLVIFGVAIIGEGLWQEAIEVGQSMCELEFSKHGMYLPKEPTP